MLKIVAKQYEVEEEIEVVNEKGETLDKITMQITPDELKEIEGIIINQKGIKQTQELEKLEKKGASEEELEKKQTEFLDHLTQCEKKFEEIVFKDKLESFKEKVGEYYFEETLSSVYDFFWNSFIDKKAKRVNTMNSDLKKITKR